MSQTSKNRNESGLSTEEQRQLDYLNAKASNPEGILSNSEDVEMGFSEKSTDVMRSNSEPTFKTEAEITSAEMIAKTEVPVSAEVKAGLKLGEEEQRQALAEIINGELLKKKGAEGSDLRNALNKILDGSSNN